MIDTERASPEDVENAVQRLRDLGVHSPVREAFVRQAGEDYGYPASTLWDMPRFYRYMAAARGELPGEPAGEPGELGSDHELPG